jgi:hypoxanthine-guanine phosphoribosyltransferase
MDEGGNTKDDLGLPKGTADADNLADQIKKDFDDGKELVVTVLKSAFACLVIVNIALWLPLFLPDILIS